MFKHDTLFFKSNIQRLEINSEDALFKYSADHSKTVSYLTTVYDQVNQHYAEAIDWYSRSASGSRRFSRTVRFIGLVCVFLAATWPAFNAIGVDEVIGYTINTLMNTSKAVQYVNQFGYLAAAIGVSAIFFDRYGGASASWIRYMRTVVLLQAHSACFQVQWSNLLTEGADLDILRDHLYSMTHTLVRTIDDETQEWAYMYMDSLNRLSSHLDNTRFSGTGRNDSTPDTNTSAAPNTANPRTTPQ